MPNPWNTLPLVMVLILCSVLAGCGSVLESGKPPRQVYLLQTPAAPTRAMQAETSVGLVVSVDAVPGLDTDVILVLGSDARLKPVANAHWTDNMPEVFASITRRYLSDTHDFSTVKVGTIARPGEWLLDLELQAFYGTQDSSGTTSGVVLKMEGRLSCNGAQHVVRIDQRSSASDDSLANLVAAHQRVLDSAMQELPALILSPCSGPDQN